MSQKMYTDRQVTEGLKFQVTSEELTTLFREGEKRQREKATRRRVQMEKVRGALYVDEDGEPVENARIEPGTTAFGGQMAARRFEDSARNAERSAEVLAFLAEHVIPNQIYILEAHDLQRVIGGKIPDSYNIAGTV